MLTMKKKITFVKTRLISSDRWDLVLGSETAQHLHISNITPNLEIKKLSNNQHSGESKTTSQCVWLQFPSSTQISGEKFLRAPSRWTELGKGDPLNCFNAKLFTFSPSVTLRPDRTEALSYECADEARPLPDGTDNKQTGSNICANRHQHFPHAPLHNTTHENQPPLLHQGDWEDVWAYKQGMWLRTAFLQYFSVTSIETEAVHQPELIAIWLRFSITCSCNKNKQQASVIYLSE